MFLEDEKVLKDYLDMKKLLLNIAQLFGIGRIGFAPGTLGSITTCLLAYPILKLSFLYRFSIILILFIIGIIASSQAEEMLGEKDPSSVVIDEVVGQLITLCFILSPNFFQILFGFITFRVLDILKPYPIKNIEEMFNSGLGIMCDDVAAGIIGGLILFGVFYLF